MVIQRSCLSVPLINQDKQGFHFVGAHACICLLFSYFMVSHQFIRADGPCVESCGIMNDCLSCINTESNFFFLVFISLGNLKWHMLFITSLPAKASLKCFNFWQILAIHRQNANNLLSKDPNGPVNPSLQPDIIHGAAAMKSTTYMALHFHFPCYSHRSQQTHVGLHATRPCRGLYPIWNSSL